MKWDGVDNTSLFFYLQIFGRTKDVVAVMVS
jgi:hypothetical protein